MRVDSIGRPIKLGQTEISDFEDSFSIDEQIVRLDVSVEDPVLVKVFKAEQGLEGVGLDVGTSQNYRWVLNNDFLESQVQTF